MNQEPTEPSIVPDSPDFLTPQGEARRNSTGKANTQSSPSLSTSDEKPLPHYLRASTGSCHDYCKYGRKHAIEGKARRPILWRSLGNNVIPEKEQNQVKVPPQERRKKKPMQKLKLTSEQETEFSGQSNVVKNKVLVAGKDIQVCESGSEGFSEDSRSMMTRTPPSPQNRNLNKTDELSEELMSIDLLGPSIVEKSIITNELIVSTEEDDFLEEPMIVELATPSPGRRSVASVEILSATEAGEFFGELPDMKEMALLNLQGVVVGFSDSALIDQEEGSGDIPISKLSEIPSLRECIVHVGEMPGNVTKEPSNSSARHSLGNQAVKSSRDPSSTASKVSSSSSSIKARSLKTSELNKGEVPKLRSTLKPKNEMPVRAKVVSHKETNMLGKSSAIQQKASSPAKKTRTSDQLKTIKQNSPNTSSSSTAKIIKSKTSSPSKKTDISARSSISLKAKTSVTKSQSPSTSGGLTGSRNQLSKISRSPDKTVEKKVSNLPRASLSPNIGEKKVLKTPRASLYPKVGDKKVLKGPRVSLSPRPAVTRISSMNLGKNGNKKLASPVKNAKKVAEQDNDQVKEKTIYVIDPKAEIKSDEDVQQNPMNCKTPLSSQTLSLTASQSSDASQENVENVENEETESTYTEVSELSSEDEDTESDDEVESQEAEESRMSKKIVSVHPEDKVQAPHKLKFRRGKIVDPQSENYGPRRLRFRKARVVTENQTAKGESGRRSFRKRSDISGEDSNVAPEAPNVVLRHQDQQGRKDTQGLFNHVIEETASKLVETRKSKVKALVGAFETVISLQETKVAPTG